MDMRKELDELKQKFKINDNLFFDSIWLNHNQKYIDLIQKGIEHQLNKYIINTSLLYRCSRDGDDSKIFHKKCDGIPYTLVIGESENNRIFGGFTTQAWDQSNKEKIDNFAFLFQLNQMKNYYAIKDKGGIYCGQQFGPSFGNHSHFSICFQDSGKSFESCNREDEYNETYDSFENYDKLDYVFDGHNKFKLKNYEIFKLYLK